MKKQIILLSLLFTCALHAKPMWETQQGVYVVNNSEGDLTLSWDQEEKTIPKSAKLCTKKSMAFIAVEPGTKVTVSYSDQIHEHAELHSCRGGAQTSFTTSRRIVAYVISGGYSEGDESYKRPGKGHHCRIKVHQRFNAEYALHKYPELQ